MHKNLIFKFKMGKLYLGDSMLSERLLDIRDEAELNQEDMAEIK